MSRLKRSWTGMSQVVAESVSQRLVDRLGALLGDEPLGASKSECPPAGRVLADDAARGSVGAFGVEHGVSWSWFLQVRAWARSGGVMMAVEPSSTRPRSSPNRTTDDVVLLVAKIRTQLMVEGWDFDPPSVLARLRRMAFTDPPSRGTLAGSSPRPAWFALGRRRSPATSTAVLSIRLRTVSGRSTRPSGPTRTGEWVSSSSWSMTHPSRARLARLARRLPPRPRR